MNDFFANLLGRHLGTCDTIQPRIPGRFEMERGTGAITSHGVSMNPVESESEQTLQSPQLPSEVFHPWPKETASEIKSQESRVSNSDHPSEPQSAFSVDAPKITIHEPDSTGSKDFSSSSFLEKNDFPAQFGLTEQHAALSNPGKPDDAQRLGVDRYSHPRTMRQQQYVQPSKTRLIDNERNVVSDKHVQINGNESHDVARDNNSPPTDKQHLENELNQRIAAMLQRLADAPVPSITEPAQGDWGSNKNESLTPATSKKKAPLLDDAVPPLETIPTSNRQTSREESKYSGDDDNIHRAAQHRQLEPPAWLPEIEARFSQLQQTEVKAEPVINVTIGRVEVRAIKSETPQSAKRQKKPVGVMSLDDYLRHRQHGKQT